MKSRIFIFALMLALVGCESGSVETPTAPKGVPIMLEISDAPTQWNTRAVLMVKDSLEKIGMFGYSHPSLALGGGWDLETNPRADYFINEVVIKDNITKLWSYEGTKYWPEETKNVSFFAYAPYSDVDDNIKVYPTLAVPTGKPRIEFITDIDVLEQVDLMWAATKNLSGGSVSFTMHHALASVEFSADFSGLAGNQAAYKSITVERVSLFYAFGRATLDLTTGAWTTPTVVKNFDLLPNHGLVGTPFLSGDPGFAGVHLVSGDSTANKDGYLMLIPQTLPTYSLVEVKLSIIDKDDKFLTGTDYFNVGGTILEAGKKYNIIFEYSGATGYARFIETVNGQRPPKPPVP